MSRAETPKTTRTRLRSGTPSRDDERHSTLSPPPPLPSATGGGKILAVTSPFIDFDPVLLWRKTEQASDPVFANDKALKLAASKIGSPLQPPEHCNPLYFPTVARRYGLVRSLPAPLPQSRSRGPTCVSDGKTIKCHKNCVPAFFYHLPDGTLCPKASGRSVPTLIFQYKVKRDKDEIETGACWHCFSTGESRCGASGTILQTVKDHRSGEDHFKSDKQADRRINNQSANDVFLSDQQLEAASKLPDSALPVPPAPKKPSLSRSASVAGLDDDEQPRKFWLRGADNPLGDATSEAVVKSQDSAGALIHASAVVFAPTPAAKGPPKAPSWRTLVDALRSQSVPPILEDEVLDNQQSVLGTAADAQTENQVGLMPAFLPQSKDSLSIGDPPQTPTPLSKKPAPTVMTPHIHLDTDRINSGLTLAKQEIARMAAGIQTAVQIADQAQKSATSLLHDTTKACEELKEKVQKERGVIQGFLEERERNADHLGALESRMMSIKEQLEAKTGEVAQLRNDLDFARQESKTSRLQAIAMEEAWQKSVAKARQLEETRVTLQNEVDSLRSVNANTAKLLTEERTQRMMLEAALLEAGEENADLNARLLNLSPPKDGQQEQQLPTNRSTEASIGGQQNQEFHDDARAPEMRHLSPTGQTVPAMNVPPVSSTSTQEGPAVRPESSEKTAESEERGMPGALFGAN